MCSWPNRCRGLRHQIGWCCLIDLHAGAVRRVQALGQSVAVLPEQVPVARDEESFHQVTLLVALSNTFDVLHARTGAGGFLRLLFRGVLHPGSPGCVGAE